MVSSPNLILLTKNANVKKTYLLSRIPTQFRGIVIHNIKVLKTFDGKNHVYMALVLICGVLLCIIIVGVYGLVSWQSPPSKAKLAPFECGFESLSSVRRPFSIRYFILVLLFLVFDVETVLLFPFVRTNILHSTGINLRFSLFVFLFLLIGGLLYEWSNNILDW